MRVKYTTDALDQHVRNPGICLMSILVFVLSFGLLSQGASVPLKVQPKGTNQFELTLGSLETNAYYQVMVRSNSPDGHWIVFTSLLSGSNSTISSIHELSGVSGLSLNTLSQWTFVAGRWEDALGDEFPMIYKELVLRMDPYSPADPYGDPMGDGWNNLQKMQNNMDPYRAYPPRAPQLTLNFMVGTNDPRHGIAVLTWQIFGGPIPDYVLIERANRTFHPATNNWRSPPPGVNGRFPTNRLPPNFRTPFGPPGAQNRGEWIAGSFTVIGRVPGQAPKNGYAEYRYIDANVDEFAQPAYRIAPHYTPPLRAVLNRVDTAEIRKTIIHVTAKPTTNGYALTVPNPIPYAWYLLLVRDKDNPTWRASGYFMSGTNREPVHLIVDKKGMQHDGQSPIGMAEVHFLPDIVGPEFVAGWGEDSDGDGLPDAYEVLVTLTDPDNADTGNTGVLDGYKDMAVDGWTALEKFRRRVDPLRTAHPPVTVELARPTEREIMNAVMPKTDLACVLQIAFRTNGATNFQPAERVPWMLPQIMNFRQQNERKDFDVRISWEFAEPQPGQFTTYPFGEEPAFHPLEVLMQKIGVQQAESFKRNLEANPPLSNIDASNLTAQLVNGYHQGGTDKGAAMQEMMLIQDNLSQDFYGKVVDQYGKPVAGAEITAQVNVMMGRGNSQKSQTDANGLFQFTGIRGRSLDVTLAKEGYQIQGHGLGTKGQNGADTSPANRCVYTMWKLKGPEPMIHDSKRYPLKPDDRVYTVDLLSKSITDGTNDAGDLYVQFKRPPDVKPRDNFNWSYSMTAFGGGLVEVTNDDYLNEAPARGYQPQYKLDLTPADAKWRGMETTFYFKSRRGQVYGHFHIRLDPTYRDGAMLEIESFINPVGSRNLEFDPAKQTEYIPKVETNHTASAAALPKPSKLISTNACGQIVCWGSMVLPLVSPQARFIAVAAGGEHSLALKDDGTVVAWGRNLSGESTVPAGLSNVVAIAAGGRSNTGFSVALKKDGTIVACGDNAHLETDIPKGLGNVISIVAGQEHCLALKKDGSVVGWGINIDGRTQAPAGLSTVIAVSVGEEHSMALRNDGTVVGWGRNQHGQANVPVGLSNVVSICSGAYFNLALRKDGTVAGWGIEVPEDLTNVTAVAAGPWDGMALRRDGTVAVWGQTYFSAANVPVGLSNVVSIASGGNDYGDHNLALRKDGTIVAWGNNNYGQSLTPNELTNIVSVAGGLGHYLAIRNDGSVVGWGGEDHQGDGQAWVPADLGLVSQVAGGWYHSLAIRTNGTVTGWGFHAFGQISPPGGLSNVIAVTTAYNHSLGLKQDGTVVAWGNPNVPYLVQVPSAVSNVVEIAAGTAHNLALKRDGTVVGWGPGPSTQANIPSNLDDIVAIAVGGEYSGDHDLALRKDGTVVAWGSNGAGQTNVPSDLTNIIAIAAGANHSLALRKDGTVVAWGANNAGQTNVPPGLSNVITVAAGGLSSVAIVVPPAAISSQLHLQHRLEVFALAAIIILMLAASFWFRRRHTRSRVQANE